MCLEKNAVGQWHPSRNGGKLYEKQEKALKWDPETPLGNRNLTLGPGDVLVGTRKVPLLVVLVDQWRRELLPYPRASHPTVEKSSNWICKGSWVIPQSSVTANEGEYLGL
jgi:hypothetical protein